MIKNKKHYAYIALFMCILSIPKNTIFAQCACFSVSLTPTSSLCPGDPLPIGGTVTGSPTAYTYSWSGTGLTFSNDHINPTIVTTPITNTVCTLSVTAPCDLITNGNFETGHYGFATNYIYGTFPGQHRIEVVNSSSARGHTGCGTFYDHTIGTSAGHMLIVDGQTDVTRPPDDIWSETVCETSSSTYTFSMYVQPISDNLIFTSGGTTHDQRPHVVVYRDGAVIIDYQFPQHCFPGGWYNLFASISSGTGGVHTYHIQNINIEASGNNNDFAIDDISLAGNITVSATTTIVPNPVPVFAPTVSYPFGQCVPSEIDLNSGCTSCTGFSWSGPSSFTSASSNPVINPSSLGSTGTYTLTATNIYGCSATETIDAAVADPPGAGSIMGDPSLCVNETKPYMALSGMGVTSISWDCNPTTIATIDAYGAVTGVNAGTAIITLTVSNVCGSAVTTKTITVKPLPVVSATLSPACSVFCVGQPIGIQFTGSPGATVSYTNQWPITGATSPTYGTVTLPQPLPVSMTPVFAETTGWYTFSSTATLNGCSASSQLISAYVDIPNASFSSSPTAKCDGQPFSLQLIGTAGSRAFISDGTFVYPVDFIGAAGTLVTASLSLSGISASTTYCITSVENICAGCSNYGPFIGVSCITVIDNHFPVLSLTTSMPVCEGMPTTLIGSGAPVTSSYNFAGPSITGIGVSSTPLFTTPSLSLTSGGGSYCMWASNEGCRATICTDVVVNPAPTVSISTNSKICDDLSNVVNLTFSGCPNCTVNYQGTDASSTVTYYSSGLPFSGTAIVTVTPTPTTTTTFLVYDVVDPIGCHSITSPSPVIVHEYPHPVATVSAPLAWGALPIIGTLHSSIPSSSSNCVTITYQLYDAYYTPIGSPITVNIDATGTFSTGLDYGSTYYLGVIVRHLQILFVTNGDCSDPAPCQWPVTGTGTYWKHSPNTNNLNLENYPSDVSIYPNPNRGNFTILQNLDIDGTLSVKITDAIGKIIYDKVVAFTNGEGKINVSSYPEGVYLVELSDSNGQKFVNKITIKK